MTVLFIWSFVLDFSQTVKSGGSRDGSAHKVAGYPVTGPDFTELRHDRAALLLLQGAAPHERAAGRRPGGIVGGAGGGAALGKPASQPRHGAVEKLRIRMQRAFHDVIDEMTIGALRVLPKRVTVLSMSRRLSSGSAWCMKR